jgi:hypothetical protein
MAEHILGKAGTFQQRICVIQPVSFWLIWLFLEDESLFLVLSGESFSLAQKIFQTLSWYN